MAKKKAFIISKFRDAGTGENFEVGSVREIETGQFGNYSAAGLVREPTRDELKGNQPADGGSTPAA